MTNVSKIISDIEDTLRTQGEAGFENEASLARHFNVSETHMARMLQTAHTVWGRDHHGRIVHLKFAVKTVTLPVNGAWQPCLPKFQHEDRTLKFHARASRYIIRTEATDFHGRWFDLWEAKAFAASMWARAEVVQVETYWYLENFGCVTID